MGVRSSSRGPPSLTPRKEKPAGDKEKVELLAEQPWQARMRSFKTRTRSTVALLGMFVLILRAGHVVVCALVFCIQARRRPAPALRAAWGARSCAPVSCAQCARTVAARAPRVAQLPLPCRWPPAHACCSPAAPLPR